MTWLPRWPTNPTQGRLSHPRWLSGGGPLGGSDRRELARIHSQVHDPDPVRLDSEQVDHVGGRCACCCRPPAGAWNWAARSDLRPTQGGRGPLARRAQPPAEAPGRQA